MDVSRRRPKELMPPSHETYYSAKPPAVFGTDYSISNKYNRIYVPHNAGMGSVGGNAFGNNAKGSHKKTTIFWTLSERGGQHRSQTFYLTEVWTCVE